MREDNTEKRMFYKFIFLLAVTLLIGLVYLWKWTADNPKEQDPEEMFQQEEQEERNDKSNGIDKEKIDEVLTEAKEEDNQHKNEDANLEQTYLENYGKQEIEQAK